MKKTIPIFIVVCGIIFHLVNSASFQTIPPSPQTPTLARHSLLKLKGENAPTDSALPREREFMFEYKATIKDIPTGAKQIDLWIPVPHDNQKRAHSRRAKTGGLVSS